MTDKQFPPRLSVSQMPNGVLSTVLDSPVFQPFPDGDYAYISKSESDHLIAQVRAEIHEQYATMFERGAVLTGDEEGRRECEANAKWSREKAAKAREGK